MVKKALQFCLVLFATLGQINCATDPFALQKARLECHKAFPIWRTPVHDYYQCVQNKTPFGAYDSEGLDESKTSAYRAKTLSPELKADIDFLAKVPEQDQSWLEMDIALKALGEGDLDTAKYVLDNVAHSVNKIYGQDESAQRARQAFNQEADKVFIGETHERAMVFHYLGLIDLARGDYQNARASFYASLLQDSLSQDETYRQDFASSLWLRGWASLCAQSDESQNDFLKVRDHITIQTPKPKDNLLVIFEAGQGPFKLVTGSYGEQLVYKRLPPSPLQDKGSFKRLGLSLANDLHFQALTRGDRRFDDYLADQAESKTKAKNFASDALLAGAVLFHMAGQAEHEALAGMLALAGVGVMIVGGVAHAIGSAINAMADIRTWRALPDSIYLMSHKVKNADNLTELSRKNASLSPLLYWIHTHKSQLAVLYASQKQCSLLWIRDRSY